MKSFFRFCFSVLLGVSFWGFRQTKAFSATYSYTARYGTILSRSVKLKLSFAENGVASLVDYAWQLDLPIAESADYSGLKEVTDFRWNQESHVASVWTLRQGRIDVDVDRRKIRFYRFRIFPVEQDCEVNVVDDLPEAGGCQKRLGN